MQWQDMNLNYIKGLNNPIVIIELIVDIMFIIDIIINFRLVLNGFRITFGFRMLCLGCSIGFVNPRHQNLYFLLVTNFIKGMWSTKIKRFTAIGRLKIYCLYSSCTRITGQNRKH